MYPGISCITKKHHLARNLMNMLKAFPNHYDFFPKTWILPQQMNDLRNHAQANQYNTKKNKVTYIVKPDNSCQGKGIYLTRNIEQVSDMLEKQQKQREQELKNDAEMTYKQGYVV